MLCCTGQPGPSEDVASTSSFDTRSSDRSQDRAREGAIPKRRAIVERSTSKETKNYLDWLLMVPTIIFSHTNLFDIGIRN